ncbi:MAG TPA: hypothetical protein VFZ34_23930 [Blastocatellia bacterium]|nr:hypothetical protein [Blastocatellia bacterium]
MAIESYYYLTYPEAVAEHIELMQLLEEVRYGVFDRSLIESALARPQQAASYNQADLSSKLQLCVTVSSKTIRGLAATNAPRHI